MEEGENYFSIFALEIPRNEYELYSSEKIKLTYKLLAKKYHPDQNFGNEEEATGRFQKLQEAYETLKEEHLQREYYLKLMDEMQEEEGEPKSKRRRGRVVGEDEKSEEQKKKEKKVELRLAEIKRYKEATVEVRNGWGCYEAEHGRNRINLLEENTKLKQIPHSERKDFTLERQLRGWAEMSRSFLFPLTIEGRAGYENWLVSQMNSWIGLMTWENKDTYVVAKFLKNRSQFCVYAKSIFAMAKMCEPYTVLTYDKALLFKYEHCERKRDIQMIYYHATLTKTGFQHCPAYSLFRKLCLKFGKTTRFVQLIATMFSIQGR